jgi:uncharacterized protein DUF6748
MVSRLLIVATVTVVLVGSVAASGSGRPATATAVYSVRGDPRLCPSPLCGGYWVTLANGVRTRCADGTRNVRCYVAKAVDARRRSVSVPNDGLVRGSLEEAAFGDFGPLGVLVVVATYTAAGTAPVSGGYYVVTDTGVRCIRAPCFSYRVTQANGSTRTLASDVDLEAAQLTAGELARTTAALQTKNGLLARGRFRSTPDGGRVFRPSRVFLRATQPRA